MKAAVIALTLAVIVAAPACGGGQHASAGSGEVAGFDCRGRKIEYMVSGGLAGVEAGVSVVCHQSTPTLRKWRGAGEGNQAESKTFELSQADFELLWKKIESTGWRYLDNCDSQGAPEDPVYTVDVGDSKSSVSLSCQGQELPFPFNRLVNELDLQAAGFPDYE